MATASSIRLLTGWSAASSARIRWEPQGAAGQAATTPPGADGAPILSGMVLREAGFPAASQGGKPNPGLLAIQFKADDTLGLYQPKMELIGGTFYRYIPEVVAP